MNAEKFDKSLPGCLASPYYFSADGLTDQEFWQVANSLK
jgi:hypothetical protein